MEDNKQNNTDTMSNEEAEELWVDNNTGDVAATGQTDNAADGGMTANGEFDNTSHDDEVVNIEEMKKQAAGRKRGGRQIFGLMGILLVFYYVYETFKPIVRNEVPEGQRTGLIIAGSILLIANVALTVFVVRDWLKQKNADKKDDEA